MEYTKYQQGDVLLKKVTEKEFYDNWNLLSLASLDYCLLCANKKVDKDIHQLKEYLNCNFSTL